MKKISLLLTFIILSFSSIFSQTTAPRIINTVPEFGDCNVDTNLTIIQFEFDQDMSPGFSLPDCSDKIPIVGNPTWKTKRILEVPVKLKPNSFYQAYLNSSNFRNFANEDGIPMNPDYFLFRSKNYKDSTIADTSLNRINYEKFCDNFLKYYSYKNLKGINWEYELKSIKDDIIKSKSNNEFGYKLLKVLKKANDIHLSIQINNQQFGSTSFRLVPVHYNFGNVFGQLGDLQISENNVAFAGKVGNTGYLLISSLESWFVQDIAFAIEKTKQLKDLPFLILDLRLNRGGDEQLALSFVSTILSDTVTYEKDAVYNASTGIFDNLIVKSLIPDITSIHYQGKIFVLIGGNVVSSAESFVLMLKQMPNVQLIGSKTYGASGNPRLFKITDSIYVNIPSWLAYDMNGKLIEGNGIEPDVKIEFPEEDFTEKDPIFEYVLDTIGSLPFISISTKSLRFSQSTSSSTTFEITSNTHWKLTSDQPWLTMECNLDSGNASITVTASENYHSSVRTAKISIAGEGMSDKIIDVTQNGAAPVLEVSTKTLTFEASANSTNTFNIVSNINWMIKSNQPWLTVDMSSGSDSAMVTATASANSTGKSRLATIVVSGNSVLPEYISINQVASISTSYNVTSPSDKIIVYPNPTSGLLYISCIKPYENESRIEVSNYLGQVVLIINRKNAPTLQIDLSTYPSGLYTISLYSGNEVYQSKVIKNSD